MTHSTAHPRRARPSTMASALLQAETNQQLNVAYKFKGLLWSKIIEQAGPELRRLLEAYDHLEAVDSLFPTYSPPTMPLRARLEWVKKANVEAERLIKGKGQRRK